HWKPIQFGWQCGADLQILRIQVDLEHGIPGLSDLDIDAADPKGPQQLRRIFSFHGSKIIYGPHYSIISVRFRPTEPLAGSKRRQYDFRRSANRSWRRQTEGRRLYCLIAPESLIRNRRNRKYATQLLQTPEVCGVDIEVGESGNAVLKVH